MIERRYFIPAATFLGSVIPWTGLFLLHALGLFPLPALGQAALSLLAGGLLFASAVACRRAGGPALGGAVRGFVLLVMAGLAFWRMEPLAGWLLLAAALAVAVYAARSGGAAGEAS